MLRLSGRCLKKKCIVAGPRDSQYFEASEFEIYGYYDSIYDERNIENQFIQREPA